MNGKVEISLLFYAKCYSKFNKTLSTSSTKLITLITEKWLLSCCRKLYLQAFLNWLKHKLPCLPYLNMLLIMTKLAHIWFNA